MTFFRIVEDNQNASDLDWWMLLDRSLFIHFPFKLPTDDIADPLNIAFLFLLNLWCFEKLETNLASTQSPQPLSSEVYYFTQFIPYAFHRSIVRLIDSV